MRLWQSLEAFSITPTIMAPRKRSLSQAQQQANATVIGEKGSSSQGPAPAAGIDSPLEPPFKRPRSDIDIIRARTASTTLVDQVTSSAPPSETGEVPPAAGVVEDEDASSPLKAKGAGDGADRGKVKPQPHQQQQGGGKGKKAGGGGRKDPRGDRDRDRKPAPTPSTTAADPLTTTTAAEADGSTAERRPKRKVAVAFGYVGTGYNGSQVQTVGAKTGEVGINTATRTIEGEIFKAFIKAGCVSEDNSANPSKVQLQRCSRTDANVHAACNVISLKLVIDPPSLTTSAPTPSDPSSSLSHPSRPLIDLLNSYLPPEIRLWSYIRVLGSFSCRAMCDSRSYEYSLPTYVFLPPKPGTAVYERLKACPGWEESGLEGEQEKGWWDGHDLEGPFQQDLDKKRSFRISPAMLGRIREAVSQFLGTHNFHNYTVGKEFRDRSATRIMKALEVSDPFLVEGTEWVSIRVYGQSFMLHQIRKMIGMIILLCRSRTPASLIPETFGPARVRIPKAPGLGLLLVHPHFSGYNQKVGLENQARVKLKSQGKGMDVPENEELEFGRWREEMEGFKRGMIYQRMWEDERGEDSFATWLNYLDLMSSSNLDYLNPKGLIPTSASAGPSWSASSSHQPASSAPKQGGESEADKAAFALFEDEGPVGGQGSVDGDDDG